MTIKAYQGISSMRIKKETLSAMHVYLNKIWGGQYAGEDLEETFFNYGIESEYDKDGNISDLWLATDNWFPDEQGFFFSELAKFVMVGSYISFFIEGEMMAYVYRDKNVTMVNMDNMLRAEALQDMITCTFCKSRFAEGKINYHWPDPKVMECISPGDTVPLGLCPDCNHPVYQNEEDE